jgi:hypothetical protein
VREGLGAILFGVFIHGCYFYAGREHRLNREDHPVLAYTVTTTDPFPGYVLLDYSSFGGHRSKMVGDPRRATPWRYEMFEQVGPDVAELSAVNLGHGCVTVTIERDSHVIQSRTGCGHAPVTVREVIRCRRCLMETEAR